MAYTTLRRILPKLEYFLQSVTVLLFTYTTHSDNISVNRTVLLIHTTLYTGYHTASVTVVVSCCRVCVHCLILHNVESVNQYCAHRINSNFAVNHKL